MKKINVRKLVKIVVGVFSICCFSFGAIFAADTTYSTIARNVGDPYTFIMDLSTTGTNTTNSQKVLLGDAEAYFLQVSATSISVGTVTPGLEVSVDNVVYGSITASEMVQTTNTLTTQIAWTTGTGSNVLEAGKYRGTHTSAINTAISVGTNTVRRYLIRPVGKYLNMQMVHTLTGTDTGKYAVSISRAPAGSW